MRIFKNRLVIGVICILLAFLIGFVLVPLVAKSSNKTISVIVANTDIPAGTKIENKMVKQVKISKKGMSDKIINSLDKAIGKYTTDKIVSDEIILKTKISEQLPFADPALYNLDNNTFAITISVKSLAASLGGKLQEGDIITVMINPKDSKEFETTKAIMFNELMYVEVIGITNQTGTDTKNASSDEDQNIPATATLKVNISQAQILAGLEGSSDIHLVLVARNNSPKAQQALALQKSFFISNYKTDEWFNLK